MCSYEYYVRRRCFPACSPSGHKCSGYCGSAAKIAVSATGISDSDYWVNRFVAVCEFRPESLHSLSSVGSISRAALAEYCRSSENPMLPYIRGKISYVDECDGVSTVSIDFNPHHIAWHYGWKSNKWTSDARHVLDMVFFEDDGTGRLHVLHGFASSTFTIRCTRSDSVASRKARLLESPSCGVVVDCTGPAARERAGIDKIPMDYFQKASMPNNELDSDDAQTDSACDNLADDVASVSSSASNDSDCDSDWKSKVANFKRRHCEMSSNFPIEKRKKVIYDEDLTLFAAL